MKGDLLRIYSLLGCGHCQRLAPEYEKAAALSAGKATLAKVDCTTNQALCQKYVSERNETIQKSRREIRNADYRI